jgi:A/G-specific adenine glycosylase
VSTTQLSGQQEILQMRGDARRSSPTAARARRLAHSLVEWYEGNRRDLPWRRTRDPYAIWISEVMLQQTRVEVVIQRYESFLARFPDLSTLASSPFADLLAEWAGLGYYRRVRGLHAAARRIHEDHGGKLPRTAAALELLPGFGRYTAGAVASIAFDEPVAAVDGNVERVFSRLLALDEDPGKGVGAQTVRAWAQALVRVARPSVLNQALMELGATVCMPRAPRCAACPWRRGCGARGSADPSLFPKRPPRRRTEEVACYVAIHTRGGKLLFRQRGADGLNAGLWELPTTQWHGGAPENPRARRELEHLGAELGVDWSVGEPVAAVSHSITHHRVRLVAHAVDGAPEVSGPLRWGTALEAKTWGLTAATRKLLGRLPTLL